VSKESRRAARLARESRRAGAAGGSTSGSPAGGGPAESTSTPSTSGGSSGAIPRSRPSTGVGARAGRRERVRAAPPRPFLERYRSLLIGVAAVVIVAVAVGYVFTRSTAATYTCTQQFNPSPTPPVEPGSSTRLGFLESEMGQGHTVGLPQNYLFCPPASGSHHGANPGVTGPIPARVYRPDDRVGPTNWIHNLEHGGLVVLYRSDSPGASAAGQQAFRDYFSAFPESGLCKVPPGQLSPVIARFDEMPHPYAALVWGRIFYLDTWDPELVNRFYLTEAERVDADGTLVSPPEDVTSCNLRLNPPSGSPAVPSGVPASVAPSASAPAASAVPSASPQPSAAPS
jgi:hypothetical protein